MSTKTKRMSAEEKRKTLLSIYHTTKQVYTEKEIISLGTKAGINGNTVADVNQSLCDDNLVDTDKIGGSKYFWSFPAKADRMKQLEYEELGKKIEVLRGGIVEAEVKLADAKRGREEEEVVPGKGGEEEGEKPMTRAAKMARRAELVKSVQEKERELDKLKENDPQAIADLEKELRLVTEAATRWTDNVYACQEVSLFYYCYVVNTVCTTVDTL